MDSSSMGKIACFLSVRSYLVTLPSNELIKLIYFDENGNQDIESMHSFLNLISFLLSSEKYYPYLGKDVLDNLYNVISYGRNIITEDREKVCNFINYLILKLNSIRSNNYDKLRNEYLASQLFMRTGESFDEYEFSSDVVESSLKEYIKHDEVIFDGIFGNSDEFVVNDLNIRFMISSFSYYCTYLPSLLENEEILKLFVYIKYVLDYANHRQFSEKYISKSVYEKHKRVLKEIQHIIDEQMDKTSLSTKDINKLKIKAKASIN
ncbi:MAG: hypothetical protein IK997_01740 [Bacilli bacterium]|nr:hypothetical protein [Bacilli bacterium]